MINAKNCAKSAGNTGRSKCPLRIDKIMGGFLCPTSFVLSAEDLETDETVRAALIAAANHDDPFQRIYPIHGFLELTDGTPEPTVKTYGYGSSVITSEGNYDWTFPYDGNICLNNKLRNFNTSDFRPIFYDSNNTLFGWAQNGELRGIPQNQTYTAPWKAATGADPMATSIKFNFKPTYINEQLGFYQVNEFAPEIVEGLLDAEIVQAGVQAKPVYKVQVFAGCESTNIGVLYDTELASAALWRASNAATGIGITITTVTFDAALKGFTITLDDEDTDYPVVGSIILSLAPVSVIKAAGVEGYESLPLTIVNAA